MRSRRQAVIACGCCSSVLGYVTVSRNDKMDFEMSGRQVSFVGRPYCLGKRMGESFEALLFARHIARSLLPFVSPVQFPAVGSQSRQSRPDQSRFRDRDTGTPTSVRCGLLAPGRNSACRRVRPPDVQIRYSRKGLQQDRWTLASPGKDRSSDTCFQPETASRSVHRQSSAPSSQ